MPVGAGGRAPGTPVSLRQVIDYRIGPADRQGKQQRHGQVEGHRGHETRQPGGNGQDKVPPVVVIEVAAGKPGGRMAA